MTDTTSAGNAPDLTVCDREPIHVPGHIQPHGVLIATFPNSRRISHLSENFEHSLGLPADGMLGVDIDRLFGPAAATAMDISLARESYAPSNVLNLTLPIPDHPRRKVLVHRHLDRMIVELENAPLHDEVDVSLSRAQSIIASLRRSETVAQLCDIAAREIRQLVGCQRVMVYRFDSNGDGTVVAEDRVAGLETYLHLRYPASDIPPQARLLYAMQRVRSIRDIEYVPAGLLAAADAGPEPLDMSLCSLRGVSPMHIEYLRNMGVRAALSIGLMQESGLWGLIVCHDGAPMVASPDMRALCDVIGQLISLLLMRVAETEQLADRLSRHRIIANIRAGVEAAGSIGDGLERQAGALLDLIGASGAMIRCGGAAQLIGTTPPIEAASEIVASIRPKNDESVIGIADAGRPGGVAERFADSASGILAMPLAGLPGDAIAWFRPEVVRTVRWGGDPRKAVLAGESGRVSPRKSFAAWAETMRGRAEPWTHADMHAADQLRQAITGALLRHAEARLAQLSAYDALTGLANRRTLDAQLLEWRTSTTISSIALLFLDLDRFKAINDSLGHEAGDEVLSQVAERLRNLAPAGSIAGRLGGDEFVLFWPGAALKQAETLANVLVQDMTRAFVLRGLHHHATASIGVAHGPPATIDALLRQADAAMYAAKRQGGGQAVVFSQDVHGAVLTRLQTEQDLFRALERRELEVYYQPVVHVPDRRIVGFEALARWRHPRRGWVTPEEFIPRAEEAGLIVDIGAWVLAGAVRQVAAWRRRRPDLTMSVNVSAHQLTEGSLSTTLAGILTAERVPAEAICVEVTESALMQDAAVRELQRLREIGTLVAVDDFGTGYSSLSYLKNLPVTTVKIDRSFVRPLGTEARADRFFGAIVDLAHTLDLRTIAEGCETERQWSTIAEAGCDAVQGWLIAPALAADPAGQLLGE
jgi:diguanylate cyclase (GGDEF)-like protein